MAGPFSSTKALNFRDLYIMKSIFYKQRLPTSLIDTGLYKIGVRLNALKIAGLIAEHDGKLRLTDSGIRVLYTQSGGRKPPMIDTLPQGRLDKPKMRDTFIVGSPLARKIAKEVSGSK